MLNLHFAGVTDVGLRNLRKLTALDELDLSYNREITDKGAANLKALAHLRRLNLSSTQVGDASAGVIGGLTDLEELSLENAFMAANLTDAGLKNFQGLKHLKKLDLTFTHVTDAGLKFWKECTG